MNKRTHKNKLKMARRLMTREEIAAGVSPWDSKAWITRAAHRATKEELRWRRIKKTAWYG